MDTMASILDDNDLEIIDIRQYDINSIPLKLEEKSKEELMENPFEDFSSDEKA